MMRLYTGVPAKVVNEPHGERSAKVRRLRAAAVDDDGWEEPCLWVGVTQAKCERVIFTDADGTRAGNSAPVHPIAARTTCLLGFHFLTREDRRDLSMKKR